ncbi:MAG: glycoside hydrolase family 88 protein [Ruthenibacterium sp.]
MNIDKKTIDEKLDLVLNALMHLQQPAFMQGENAEQTNTKRGVYARDFGMDVWDWPQGVGLYGLEKLQTFCGDARYDAFLEDWMQNNFKEGLPSRNINTTAPYLTLLSLAQRTQNTTYEALCKQQADWLLNGLPHTKDGGFQHVTTGFTGKDSVKLNESELWIDTLFMAVLFLAKAGAVYQNETWTAEAVRQILIHIKYLYEKKTGLFYHGWSFNRNDNFGGIFWSRGNAWFTYGILELLETFGDTIDSGLKGFILDTFKAQINAIVPLQAESGLWHTILDDAESYEEVSGTAAFAAGILKGIRLGILDDSLLPCAEKALCGVIANIGADGIVAHVSSGTGIGLDADHYKNIVIAPISYGQSMTMFALIEALYHTRSMP